MAFMGDFLQVLVQKTHWQRGLNVAGKAWLYDLGRKIVKYSIFGKAGSAISNRR
jgi:hypothetical protein